MQKLCKKKLKGQK